jgi:hypothetical protein
MAALILCLCAATALAQSNTGNLVGTIVDPSGGAVAGATVTITDNATGRTKTVQASGEGTFAIPQLEVGVYTVKITAQGYKTYTATELKIDVAKEYSLNVSLDPGALEENVTVVAGADVLNATSAELNTTVGTRQIQELPLNGRNPLALIGLQAGTASNGATNTVINGQQSSFTNITRDGLNVQDNFIRANATDFSPDRPNVDDVGEFNITTQNAGAEQGYGASQVQLVTPRGSSEFHGSAFIYNRNSKFSASDFFTNRAGQPKPFLNRNQFGGRLSGPLPLPRFGEGGPSTYRNKGFFFGSYEGFRLRQSTLANRTILTANARNGIFTYPDAAGNLRTINLLTAAGVPLDPVIASRILANIPAAGNNNSIGDQRNTTGFTFNRLQNQDRESVTTRFDVEANSANSFSFIMGWRKELLLRPDVDNGGFTQTPFGFQDNVTRSFVGAWRWSPTASFTNEVRLGYLTSLPKFDRNNEPTDFFLTLPLISSPESTFQAQGRDAKQGLIQDNAVYTAGNHSIRFGGQFQPFKASPFGPPAFAQSSIPTLAIGQSTRTPALLASAFPGGISATELGNANALLALLGGFVSGANQTFNATSTTSGFVQGARRVRNLEFENYSLYASDSWRASPRLTLNFGLRYELFTPVKERDRLGLEPVIPEGTDPVAAILNPNGRYDFVGTNAGGNKFFKTDWNNFAPNFSFAYSPNFKNSLLGSMFPGEGRTVIRGGYKISYVNDEFIRGADNAISGNLGLTQTQSGRDPGNVNLTTLNGRLGVPSSLPTFPTLAFQVPRTFAQNNVLAGNFGTVFAIDPDLKVPMTQEFNLGIQRELGFQTVFEARFVHARSNNLIRGIDYNQTQIFSNGFLADFERARRNLSRFNDPACTAAQVISRGCELLTVFPLLELGGLLSNGTIRTQIAQGQAANLANVYITNQFVGSSQLFLPNPNTGVADLLGNSARFRYVGGQFELRRRFAQGLQFQANYTFQKTLTDTGGVGQTNFDPVLDINNIDLEYSRADYDAAHVFNFNGIYELPFGKGKRFLNEGGLVNAIFGGFQFNSIVQIATGAPFSILDTRGTLNRAGRSTRQTANTNLSKEQVKDLVGVFRTPCGVYFINPSVLNINQTALANGQCSSLGTGRGAEGIGTTPFAGQVFFNVAPGQTGNMERHFLNGPTYINWDASIIKNIPLDGIKEGMRFQIRGEAFNVMNRANFFVGNESSTPAGSSQDINSTNFGKINSFFSPRIIQFVGRLEF